MKQKINRLILWQNKRAAGAGTPGAKGNMAIAPNLGKGMSVVGTRKVPA